MIALKSSRLHHVMNIWCSFNSKCHILWMILLNTTLFSSLLNRFLRTEYNNIFFFYAIYVLYSSLFKLFKFMPIRYRANYANCTLSYIFWFAPWTTKAYSFFFLCLCICVRMWNKWTCLRRARYYARIVCSLFLSPSISLSSSVKINQMMELMSDRLSWIYMHVYMVRTIT